MELIIIGAAVLILVATLLTVSVKNLVKIQEGEVFVTKSISGVYKLEYGNKVVIPGVTSGFKSRIPNGTVNISTDINCKSGTGTLRDVLISYSYLYNTQNPVIDTLKMTKESLESSINDYVILIVNSVFNRELQDVSENLSSLISESGNLLNEKVEKLGVRIISFNMNFYKNSYNVNLINSVYAIDEPKPEPRNEVEIESENLEKLRKLNKIKFDRAKEESDSEIKLKEIQLEKQSKLDDLSYKRSLENKKKESENLLKSKEIEIEQESKINSMEEKSELESINKEKSVKLAKIKSELESKSEEIKSSNQLEEMKLESKMSIMNKETDLKMKEFESQEKLHEEEKKSSERKLELSVIIPAKSESEKNLILAKNKSDIKKMDTESSIELSKMKLDFKKLESKELSEIKKSSIEVEEMSYKSILSVSSSDPELSVKLKRIDAESAIAKMKYDALSKLDLSNITHIGSDFFKNFSDDKH